MCFEMLGKDSVMVGTYGGGLCIINLKTGKSRSITEKQGLANNSVYGILRQGDIFGFLPIGGYQALILEPILFEILE